MTVPAATLGSPRGQLPQVYQFSLLPSTRLDFAGETQRHSLLNQIIGSDHSAILPAVRQR